MAAHLGNSLFLKTVFGGAVALACMAAVAPIAASAADDKGGDAPPALYQQVLDCQKVADAAARLACYDKQVAALGTATAKRDIVVTDREEIRKTRRGLFGFTAPMGRLLGLGGGEDDADDVKKIETKVTEVRKLTDGWELTFAEGGTWLQTDVRQFVLSPKVGQKAVISRGVLGSFVISVDGQSGIKFRRVK